METATDDDIAELLGDRADPGIVERIANLGVTQDEVLEALDDLDHEARFGEARIAASPRIDEIRTILEELPYDAELGAPASTDDDEDEGLSVREGSELGIEAEP